MNLAEKVTHVLGIQCGMHNGYLRVYGRIVMEVEGAMYAYLPAQNSNNPPADNTTTFNAAHENLLAKIQKIMYDLGEAPLDTGEITKLDQAIQNAQFPVQLMSMDVNLLYQEIEASEGLIKWFIILLMRLYMGPSCPQGLQLFKSTMDGLGLKAMLEEQIPE